MSAATAEKQAALGSRYLPIPIESLDEEVLTLDIYLRQAERGQFALYRGKGIPFSSKDHKRLVERGVRFVYIPAEQHREYRKALVARLDRLYDDPKLKHDERARIIRTASTQLIEEALSDPTAEGAIESVTDLGDQFANWLEKDPQKFSYLLDISEHDFYTATHMLNVGIGCGILMSRLCPEEPELVQLAFEGGLLHDIGKRDVPEAILNKEGQLEESEWKQIQRHPSLGYEILSEHGGLHSVILEMTRDHHEHLDGTGYPSGRKADDLSLAARVCAVVDVFDAISAARPYRGPTPPLDTLKILAQGAGAQFDADALMAWTKYISQSLKDDPSRAPIVSTGQPLVSLDELLVAPPEGFSHDDDYKADDREISDREHARHACDFPVEAAFIVNGLKEEKTFKAQAKNLSLGGVQIQTNQRIRPGEVLFLAMSAREGSVVDRTARVVHVKELAGGDYLGGLKFIALDDELV